MRRKPYSELLALANRGSQAPTPQIAPPKPLPVAVHSPDKPISPEAAARCRAELKILASMIEQHRRSTDGEGQKMCLFVDEKLIAASVALDRGDGDGSWIQLFGAAKLCRTFQIQPEESERVISRLNSMLG
jgi:hypothetical protein